MSKHIDAQIFLAMPSGARVHPFRLIQKDGSLMWRHALGPHPYRIPLTCAIEQHIIKTAQRLEELSSWLESEDGEPALLPVLWYDIREQGYEQGIQCRLSSSDVEQTLQELLPHVLPHESLSLDGEHLVFKRC